MKKLFFFLSILLSAAYGAHAQYYYQHNDNRPGAKFGVSLGSGVAVGPISSVFSEAGEFALKLELPISRSAVSMVFSAGYTFYVSGGGYDLEFDPYGYGLGTDYYGDVASFIPLQAGLKAYVSRRVFIEGDLGASFNVNGYSADYTYRPTALVYNTSIGYTVPLGFSTRQTFDVSLGYENRPEPGGGYSQILAKAVWNFGL